MDVSDQSIPIEKRFQHFLNELVRDSDHQWKYNSYTSLNEADLAFFIEKLFQQNIVVYDVSRIVIYYIIKFKTNNGISTEIANYTLKMNFIRNQSNHFVHELLHHNLLKDFLLKIDKIYFQKILKSLNFLIEDKNSHIYFNTRDIIQDILLERDGDIVGSLLIE